MYYYVSGAPNRGTSVWEAGPGYLPHSGTAIVGGKEQETGNWSISEASRDPP